MKRLLTLLAVNAAFLGSVSTIHSGDTIHQYRQELKALKKHPSFQVAFDKETNQSLAEIERDIENYKELNSLARFARFMFLAADGLVVTAQTMPKLHAYVDTLCKNNDIETPVVFISRHKGILNAFAAKLLISSGGIFIGQDVLLQASDEEIEGVLAHEIGHIKYNHVNKIMALQSLAAVASYKCIVSKIIKGKVTPRKVLISILLGQFISQFVIGKRFEKEADAFAYKENDKGNGLIQFFERLEKKDQKIDAQFEEVSALLEKQASHMEWSDSFELKYRYFITKNVRRIYRWIYHNTRLGAHPSHQERTKTIQEHLK